MSGIKVYPVQNLTLTGGQTPPERIYKSESHKLHESFPFLTADVATNKIFHGAPVALKADGNIVPLHSPLAANRPVLGISIHDSDYPTYTPTRQSGGVAECTIMVRGFAITRGIASGDVEAGYVIPDGVEGEYVKYKSAGTAGTPAVPVVTNYIAIEPADDTEMVRILHV